MAGEDKGRSGKAGSAGVGICTLEDTHGSWEVVHTPGSTEGGHDDGGSWDQVVGEGVVKVALERDLASECQFSGGNVPEARRRRSRHRIPSHTYVDVC